MASPLDVKTDVKTNEKGKKNKKKCLVPPKNCEQSLPWTRHVHQIIKECSPQLLSQENVIDAYNAFVHCMTKYSSHIVTSIPYNHSKYNTNIVISYNPEERLICGLKNVRFIGNNPHMHEEIFYTYSALFELIKNDVVPYIEQKHKEYNYQICKKGAIKDLERYQKCLFDMSERLDRDVVHYQKCISDLHLMFERDNKRVTGYIDDIKNKLKTLDENMGI